MTDGPDRDLDDVVTVTQAGITVEKSFTTDEFPVPAVKFVLRSETDDPVEVRLTDEIPDAFDMERIGFHPEYEGDAWTAYRDHRVEYERTVDPGEEVTTVYGVRLDDPSSGARFLTEPRLERVSEAGSGDEVAADPDDILGRETTGAVRDALTGKGELAADAGDPGPAAVDLDEPDEPDLTLEDRGAAEVEADVEAGGGDDGIELDDSGAAGTAEADRDAGAGEVELDESGATGTAEADRDAGAGEVELDESGGSADTEASEPDEETPAPGSLDPDLTPAVEPAGTDGVDATATADNGEPEPEATGAPGALPGNVAAALAAEVRHGSADEDDLAVLREALAPEREPEIPTSLEVRIDRLQNRTEDLAAYTDALEAFLDEEGTGQEILDRLDDRTETLREDLDAVVSETEDIDRTVSDHDDRLDDVEGTAADLTDDVASLEEDLETLGSRVEDLEADLDGLAGDAEASVDDLRGTLDDVEATMADIEDEIEDLQSFRDRMREAFGS